MTRPACTHGHPQTHARSCRLRAWLPAALSLCVPMVAAPVLAQAGAPTNPASSAAAQGSDRQGQQAPGQPQGAATGKPSASTNVNSAQVKTGDAVANPADLPAVVPTGRRVIGVALEGGGALGLAHIGVLQWMEEHRIPVDRLSGTSMGALVGALYASGMRPAELQRVVTLQDFTKLFYLRSPFAELSYRRREDERDFPEVFKLGLKGGPSFRNALISDSGLNDFLYAQFSRYNSSGLRFDTLPIPFRCVAADLNIADRVVFEGGPLPQAIRASISIPGVFSPVTYKGHFLIDGALVDNLPVDIVRDDLHADVVIGVHLVDTAFQENNVSSVFGVLSRAFTTGVAFNEKIAERQADTLVRVQTGSFSTSDYAKANELIAAGYAAAAASAQTLQKYSLSEADYAQYLADRERRIRPQPGTLQLVKVEGSSSGAQASAAFQLKALAQQPIQPETVARSMHRITGNGTDQVTYETFQPGTQPAPAVSAPAAQLPDTGVLVRLSPVRQGPPFLEFGIDATAATSNVSRGTLDLRLLQTNFGGYGSELRSEVRLGFLTEVRSQYYRQLSLRGYFAKPEAGILRQPVYLWQNQRRLSEHLQQQAGGGLEVGRTFNRYFQASAGYLNQIVRWHPVQGTDGTAPVSGDAQTATAHLKLDTTLSGLAPAQTGIRVELTAGALFHSVGSQTAPLTEFSLRKPFRLSDTQALYLSLDANSYFRRNVTQPLRFTMGGPLRLSASSIAEYRGTDNALARVGYMRRFASLPSGLGQGIYLGTAYEAAEIWSPEQRAILRQDGLITIIGAFPIGDLTLGGAVGDAGRRKVFVTFGRLF